MDKNEIYSNVDMEQECIYKVVGTYNLIIKELEKVFIPYGISASKFNILIIIKHHAPAEGISQVEITKKLIVGDSNVAKLTNKLYEDGYITRETNMKDRRYNLLKITQKGSTLVDNVWKIYKEKINSITKSLNKEEKETIIKLLSKWSDDIM